MTIPYGSLNDKNEFWDGSSWCKWNHEHLYYGKRREDGTFWIGSNWCNDDRYSPEQEFLIYSEKGLMGEYRSARHDGVFKCPRCWNWHSIADNLDLLCDGCFGVIPSWPGADPAIVEAVLEWQTIKREHYKGKPSELILAQYRLRDELHTKRTEDAMNKDCQSS